MLFGPGADSGTFDYFTEAVNGKAKSSRGDFTASEDDNVLVQGVENNKCALGYFGFAYYAAHKDKLRAVAIDGGKGPVAPSIETVINGTYSPLSRPLFIYVKESSAARPEVKEFVEFCDERRRRPREGSRLRPAAGLRVPAGAEALQRPQARIGLRRRAEGGRDDRAAAVDGRQALIAARIRGRLVKRRMTGEDGELPHDPGEGVGIEGRVLVDPVPQEPRPDRRAAVADCGLVAVFTTAAIVFILVYESSAFFDHVSIRDFLTDTMWTPLFADARYGIMPLVAGTLTVTGVALLVAIPLGTIIAIYLSEFASHRLRETVKPVLELLGAVPTVVYGYFALLMVTPMLQKVFPELPGFNMLSAGLVIGLMIIPYVATLSEDAMRAVPRYMREGSYAMGATKLQTALRVVVPGAFSGLAAAYILGISRAVGETMVVAIAAGMQPNLTFNPTEPAATITAYIVQVSLGDLPHGSIGYQSIFAAGLVLMLFTLVFNVIGFFLTRRFREAY